MAQLPVDRTTESTAADHVGDHDELHRVHNQIEGESLPERVQALEDAAPSGAGVLADGSVPMAADLDLASHKIVNLTDPTAAQDAATRAYVLAQIAALIDSAPGLLNTLNEIAVALGNDANFAATITTALAGKQPLDSDLTAIAALTTTSYGRALLALADAAAGRTALGLGTAALSAVGDFQPIDSDLTAIAALSTTSFGRAFLVLADVTAARTALGLGSSATHATTDYQPVDSDLTAIAALTTTSFGRALLTLADAAAGRTALALGTAATHAATDFDAAGAAAGAETSATAVANTKVASVTGTSVDNTDPLNPVIDGAQEVITAESGPIIVVRSKVGIDGSGIPYYDADGAADGEDAVLSIDPYTGALSVIKPDVSAATHDAYANAHPALRSRITALESSSLPVIGGGDAGKVVTVNGTHDGYELDAPGSSGGLLHVAVPIAFNTADLSSPYGAITGVLLYTPTVGDILLDAWLQLDVGWGVVAQFDMGTFVGTNTGLFVSSTSGSAIGVNTIPDAELAGAGMKMNAIRPSLASGQYGSSGARTAAPAIFTATNPLLAVVSNDGTNTGSDPGASTGSAVVHLLIVPA